jgi:uncharacterized protein YdeI (YjbR/CyaY-like superfamily)
MSQATHKLSSAKLRSKALEFTTRNEWREWLNRNHASKDEVLLVIYKREPKTGTFSNLDAIEEALCFGWIDGWFRPVDSEHKVQRYTPRRKGSSWSDYNIARAWKLLDEKKMTPAGRAKLPSDVIKVWRDLSPQVTEVDPRNRVIRFADNVDYLSKIRRPTLTP